MGIMRDFFGIGREPEQRMISDIAGIERPGADILQVYGLGDVELPSVTVDTALQVPAVWAAVSFLSRTLAALPLHAYRKTETGPARIVNGLETLIHEAPNPQWTSFKLRQWFWQQVFTKGRGLLWVERSGTAIVGLWPIIGAVTIKRDERGATTYKVNGRPAYDASEVVDIAFMLKADGTGHYGPIERGALAIQLALAMNHYGSKFFAGGGVPPLALEGPLPANNEAMKRAMNDIGRSIDAAKKSDKPIFPMPPGYRLTQVGFDPEKGQMTDARRFQVEEIARAYNIPPAFLQDLTRATFTNAEQQDLHLVKHLVGQWAEAFEQELNLKLFGQKQNGRYVEHNLDGLLRGDFKTRMEGLARAVQSSILSPDEARALENRQAKGGNADNLFIQSGTVPIDSMTNEGGEPPNNGDSTQ